MLRVVGRGDGGRGEGSRQGAGRGEGGRGRVAVREPLQAEEDEPRRRSERDQDLERGACSCVVADTVCQLSTYDTLAL